MPATQKDPRWRTAGAAVVVLLLCGCGREGSPGREQLQEEFRRLAEGFDRETGTRRISAAELESRGSFHDFGEERLPSCTPATEIKKI